ncbi:MAG: hypothetical protein VYA67_22130 [Actinomycetota bacterium]|nr:hypothetical protein [Actinomycetota bacterium]
MRIPVSLIFAILFELAAVAFCAANMPSPNMAAAAGGLISLGFVFALVTR